MSVLQALLLPPARVHVRVCCGVNCVGAPAPSTRECDLTGHRVFTEVIEFTRGHQVALIQHDRCLSKEEDLDTKPERRSGAMTGRRRAEGCIIEQRTPELGARAEAGTVPALGPSEEALPCWHLDFELLASRTARQRVSVLSRPTRGSLLQRPWEAEAGSRPHFAHEEAEAQGGEALHRRPQQGHAAGIQTQSDRRFLTLSTGHTATHAL